MKRNVSTYTNEDKLLEYVLLCYDRHRSISAKRLATFGSGKESKKCPQLQFHSSLISVLMMTSSNGNIFRVTDLLCEGFIGHRWIPLTKASDAELWCFLWSAPWINGWVNNRKAGDLRRHRAHYDVIVMSSQMTNFNIIISLFSNYSNMSALNAVSQLCTGQSVSITVINWKQFQNSSI